MRKGIKSKKSIRHRTNVYSIFNTSLYGKPRNTKWPKPS